MRRAGPMARPFASILLLQPPMQLAASPLPTQRASSSAPQNSFRTPPGFSFSIEPTTLLSPFLPRSSQDFPPPRPANRSIVSFHFDRNASSPPFHPLCLFFFSLSFTVISSFRSFQPPLPPPHPIDTFHSLHSPRKLQTLSTSSTQFPFFHSFASIQPFFLRPSFLFSAFVNFFANSIHPLDAKKLKSGLSLTRSPISEVPRYPGREFHKNRRFRSILAAGRGGGGGGGRTADGRKIS